MSRFALLFYAGLVASVVLMVWGAGVDEHRPWFVAGTIAGFVCLAVIWCQCKAVISKRGLLAGALLLRVIMLWMPGGLSDDSYRYLWDGALVRAGENPYLSLPVELAGIGEFAQPERAEWFREMNSPGYYSIYPPFSQLAFALAGTWGHSGLKVLFALAELGALLLLARVLPPGRLLLYAWNPLVILETWGQLHTEALALLFLAWGIVAWADRRNAVVASAAFTLAAWVKLFPLLLLPFLWRRVTGRDRVKCILSSAGISLVLIAPFFSPAMLAHMLESSHLYMLSFEFNAGPYYLLKWLTTVPLRAIGWLGEDQDTSKVIGPLMRAAFLCGLVWLWRRDRKCKAADDSFLATCSVFVVLFLFTFVNLHPWYLTFAFLFTPWMSVRQALAWMWLGAFSVGTYLSYTLDVYWPFVIVGWAGFAAVLLAPNFKIPRSLP